MLPFTNDLYSSLLDYPDIKKFTWDTLSSKLDTTQEEMNLKKVLSHFPSISFRTSSKSRDAIIPAEMKNFEPGVCVN